MQHAGRHGHVGFALLLQVLRELIDCVAIVLNEFRGLLDQADRQ